MIDDRTYTKCISRTNEHDSKYPGIDLWTELNDKSGAFCREELYIYKYES